MSSSKHPDYPVLPEIASTRHHSFEKCDPNSHYSFEKCDKYGHYSLGKCDSRGHYSFEKCDFRYILLQE
jgi:hypothetical protein